jgi:hypothetical protein
MSQRALARDRALTLPIRVILAKDHPLGRQGLWYYLEESGLVEVTGRSG